MEIGIVGLPNAGKSTLFNALAARRLAPTAAHPFTTVTPHEAVVAVPDENLDKLAELIHPEKTTPATVTFIDIAGLVKGAHQGEGLGNQFLAKIRETDAIVHVVRAFVDERVPHVHGQIDPPTDIEVVNSELQLAGISKPTIYVVNVGEGQLGQPPPVAAAAGSSVVTIAAKLEEDLLDLEPADRASYLTQLGVTASSLDQLIRQAYKILGLITFYTIKGGKEVRAWAIRAGSSALEAAAKVHTDFAKHFIKAEVIGVEELLAHGSWNQAKQRGVVQTCGREYRIQEREVVEFKVGV